MTELNIEHILLFFITAFLIYHLKGSCRDGFNVGIETNAPLCTNTRVTDWKPKNDGYTGCVCPNGMIEVQDTSPDPKTNKKKNLYRCQDKKTVTKNCENFFKKCMCEEKKHQDNFILRYNTCIKKTEDYGACSGTGWADCTYDDGKGFDDTKCKKKYNRC